MTTATTIILRFEKGVTDVLGSDGNPLTGQTFYFFRTDSTTWATDNYSRGNPHGNFSWSRSLNKNLIPSNLPVSTFTGGGLAVDIGMAEDSFDFNFECYSNDEYRYLYALCKENSDLKTGTLTFIVDGTEDTYSVGIKNIQCNSEPGQGFHVSIKLSFMVVDPELAE